MSTPILTKLILTLTNQGGKLLQRPDGQPPPDGQSQPTESLLKTCMQEWQQQHRLQKLEPAVAAAVDAALAGCGFPDLAAAAGQVWEFAGRVRHDVMCQGMFSLFCLMPDCCLLHVACCLMPK